MLRKHSVSIQGHQTSFSLEDEFWEAFQKIAEERKIAVARLVREIDQQREPTRNLSSAIRVFVLNHTQTLATQISNPQANGSS